MSNTDPSVDIPFRRSPKADLAQPLSDFLASVNQPPDSVAKESLGKLNELRDACMRVFDSPQGATQCSIATLRQHVFPYLVYLYFACDRFPSPKPSGEGKIKDLSFTWYSGMGVTGGMKLSKSSLRTEGVTSHTSQSLYFELLNVLWNVAAVYGSLAAVESRSSEASLTAAFKLYNEAAGVCEAVIETVIPRVSEFEMESFPRNCGAGAFLSLKSWFIAHAHHCGSLKAAKLGHVLTPQLFVTGSQLFDIRQQLDVDSAMEHSSSQSNICGVFLNVCLARANYELAKKLAGTDRMAFREHIGEEISRLREAMRLLDTSDRFVKNVAYVVPSMQHQSLVAFIAALRKEIDDQRAKTVEVNDMCERARVPAFENLPVLQPAPRSLGKPTPPFSNIAELYPMPEDPFRTVVPGELKTILDNAQEGVDSMVDKALHKLNEELSSWESRYALLQTESLANILESRIQNLPSGIPSSLHATLSDLRDRAGPMPLSAHLEETRDRLKRLSIRLRDHLAQVDDVLAEEAAEDIDCRQHYGPRWQRPTSEEGAAPLWSKYHDFKFVIAKARDGDATIDAQYESLLKSVDVLDRTEAQLAALFDVSSQSGASAPTDQLRGARDELAASVGVYESAVAAANESIAQLEGIKGAHPHLVAIRAGDVVVPQGSQHEVVGRAKQACQTSIDATTQQVEAVAEAVERVQTAKVTSESLLSADPREKHILEASRNVGQVAASALLLLNRMRDGETFYSSYEAQIEGLLASARDFARQRTVEKENILKRMGITEDLQKLANRREALLEARKQEKRLQLAKLEEERERMKRQRDADQLRRQQEQRNMDGRADLAAADATGFNRDSHTGGKDVYGNPVHWQPAQYPSVPRAVYDAPPAYYPSPPGGGEHGPGGADQGGLPSGIPPPAGGLSFGASAPPADPAYQQVLQQQMGQHAAREQQPSTSGFSPPGWGMPVRGDNNAWNPQPTQYNQPGQVHHQAPQPGWNAQYQQQHNNEPPRY